MTDEEKERRKREYEALLALFLSLLRNIGNDFSEEEALYALAELRTEIAMDYAFDGFELTKEQALLLLRNLDDYNLTKFEKDQRDRLVAALNNVSEFSTCAEYQLMNDAKQLHPNLSGEDIDFDDEDFMEEYESLCELYNDTYASVEHSDIEYAMAIALLWIQRSEDTYLEYMTQNDDRVRPWHYALQGFTAKKSEFPAWMIPPIEWRCRCFLVTLDGDVYAKSDKLKHIMAKAPEKPAQLDGVFSDSVAKCGRIFGKAHRYFTVKSKDKDMLNRIVNKIRDKYYGKG